MEISKKSEIRNKVKEKRRNLDMDMAAKWDQSICEQLLNLDEIRKSFCIYCYVSAHHEVGTWKIIAALISQGKFVAVPKVIGKDMEFYAISGKTDLEEGSMGIMEPKSTCLKIHDLKAPVIVPGIAFDMQGNRIGYGGGFYDRFFKREPNHPRIAIAYDFQIFDQIPIEPHDIPVHQIINP